MRHWFWGWFKDSILEQNRNINILFARTDKRTKEFEIERQSRVLLRREVKQLKHELRRVQSDMKCWSWLMHDPKVRENLLKFADKGKNEPT